MKPLQFEFELTHRATGRRDQMRATARTESEAHQSIAAYYGDLYYVATAAHRIRPAHCVIGEIDCTL